MSDSIKKIYLGLPEHLSSKVLWVGDKYRTNELSHQPGGFDIVIEYHSDNVLGYDRVKRPGRYARKILAEEARKLKIEYDYNDEAKVLEISKNLMKAAYCKHYDNEADSENTPFEKVWDSDKATISIVDALNDYENSVENKMQSKPNVQGNPMHEETAEMYKNNSDRRKALDYYVKALNFYLAMFKQDPENQEVERKISEIKHEVRCLKDVWGPFATAYHLLTTDNRPKKP